jgi:apolipoprotein N-acyltransferase
VSGVLFALSFPDYSIGWLAFVAFLPLIVAIVKSRSGWQAALVGWVSQTTAWLIMVPWVVRVMSHYGGLPQFAGILIFITMSMILGFYGALFAFLVWRIRPGERFAKWLLIPLAWAAVEYARTYLLTGFPWNLIVTAIVDYTSFVQFDRVAGPYLVGAMILLPATVGAWLITHRKAPGFERGLVIATLVIVMFVWWATGLVASKLIVRPTGTAPHIAVLLQPNISQEMRWNETNLMEIYQRMVKMTVDAVRSGAHVVIWPESTVPLSFSTTEFYRSSIESLSGQYDVDIILGSVAEDATRPGMLWNAAFLVSGGKTVGHYDKIRLVPFGEYVPLRKLLFFADKLVHAVGDFQFGANEMPLAGKFRYGPAICYEIVYPQITRTQVRNGANVLVTITNDAWYDGTSAPRQHLNQARLRAIEDDRYILRAGTTGISALIDPTGRIIKELPMGQQGTIRAEFWTRTSTTPYVRFGDWFAWVAIAAVLIAVVRIEKSELRMEN